MGKKVNSLLNDICTSLGYTKKGDLFIRPITSDINLTIFFNLAARQIKGHVFVAPFIGLQYNNVEKLVREVSQSEWIKGYTSTINEHIYHLTCLQFVCVCVMGSFKIYSFSNFQM